MNEREVTAVFDCMIFLQAAARKRGPAAACLHLVEEGKASLYLSDSILEEVEDVLSRPAVRRRNLRISDEAVEGLLRFIEQHAVVLNDVPRAFTFERDPDDEKYVNLALAANASYIVSRDKDLLNLMSDAGFCSRFPQLTIVDPVEFLRILRTTGSNQ